MIGLVTDGIDYSHKWLDWRLPVVAEGQQRHGLGCDPATLHASPSVTSFGPVSTATTPVNGGGRGLPSARHAQQRHSNS